MVKILLHCSTNILHHKLNLNTRHNNKCVCVVNNVCDITSFHLYIVECVQLCIITMRCKTGAVKRLLMVPTYQLYCSYLFVFHHVLPVNYVENSFVLHVLNSFSFSMLATYMSVDRGSSTYETVARVKVIGVGSSASNELRSH